MNRVSIGGFNIEVDGDNIRINGVSNNKTSGSNYTIIKDTVFKQDFNGTIEVKGDNVKIIIEGDCMGNIVGNCDVVLNGDMLGNMVGNMNIKK
jgi:hypothetical protein